MTINEQCVTEAAYRQIYKNVEIEKWKSVFKTSSM